MYVLALTEAEKFYHALSNYKQTLEELTIVFEEYRDPQSKSLTVIPHLLPFTQLQSLQLTIGNHKSCIYLDNNLLLEAMSAWPHIHTLIIEDYSIRPSVTFYGLFTALRQCPHLESLCLSIDTVNIDIDPDAEPIQHTSLYALHLETSESYIGNAKVLARIIFNWLPYVKGTMIDDDCDPWEEVNAHLVSLRTAALHATGAVPNI
ncbi:hypothetical protein BDR07DRAFT_957429 [Suillus spraguei]|nr:hypothetical protein BDR07DRAFT_957429 [Suillus spraguei]